MLARSIDLTLDDDRVLPVPLPDWCPEAYARLVLGYAEHALDWPWVDDEDGLEGRDGRVLHVCRQFLEAVPIELSRSQARNMGSLIEEYWRDYYCFQSIEGDFMAIGRAVAERLSAHPGGPFMATLTDCGEVLCRLGHHADDGEDLDHLFAGVASHEGLAELPADHPVRVAATRMVAEVLPLFLDAADRLGCPGGDEPDAPPSPDARAASPGCCLR